MSVRSSIIVAAFAAVTGAGALAATSALAKSSPNTLLAIEISDPSAVFFTGTGAPSWVTVCGRGGSSVVLDTPLAAIVIAGNIFPEARTLIATAGFGGPSVNVVNALRRESHRRGSLEAC
jgi:hypothetical protein